MTEALNSEVKQRAPSGRLLPLVRLLGWLFHVPVSNSYEVQIQDHQGCWRIWSNGFLSDATAREDMEKCKAKGMRWNPHRPGVFRVVQKIAIEFEPNGMDEGRRTQKIETTTEAL